jgi:hypothetical protein
MLSGEAGGVVEPGPALAPLPRRMGCKVGELAALSASLGKPPLLLAEGGGEAGAAFVPVRFLPISTRVVTPFFT